MRWFFWILLRTLQGLTVAVYLLFYISLHHQLYLSMVWDRVDLAEEKIFVHGNQSLGKDFFFQHGKRKFPELLKN